MQIVSMTAEHVSRLAELEKLCFSGTVERKKPDGGD